MVVYYGDSMNLASTIRICGDHFTRDLAQSLCLTFEDAELLKMETGCAIAANCATTSLVELPTPDDREPRQAQRKFVVQVLEARARELFRHVRAELGRVGMDRALIGGVYLTGSGAKLPDICDIAEQELHCQARFGMPFGILEWPESLNDPEWSAAAGLAMYSAKMKSHSENQRELAGWLGKILK
jgi:cell division protein FtsA